MDVVGTDPTWLLVSPNSPTGQATLPFLGTEASMGRERLECSTNTVVPSLGPGRLHPRAALQGRRALGLMSPVLVLNILNHCEQGVLRFYHALDPTNHIADHDLRRALESPAKVLKPVQGCVWI